MTIAVTSPVTGGAQTGFTSPTYTLTVDMAPDVNAKQWAVTGLGGTQVGVAIHSQSSPFTVTVSKQKTMKVLSKPNPITNLLKDVPMNVTKVLVRKGVLPLAGQPHSVQMIRGEFSTPAGADSADPANLRAAVSLFAGVITQQSSGIGDTIVSGLT